MTDPVGRQRMAHELYLSVMDGVYSLPAAGVPVRFECAPTTGELVTLTGTTRDDGGWTSGPTEFPVPAGRAGQRHDPRVRGTPGTTTPRWASTRRWPPSPSSC